MSPLYARRYTTMNIQKMMKQAAKMQEQLTASLAEKTIEVSVGGGKVTVSANGLGDIVGIKIAKEVVDPEDVEMLEDLILSGVKQAIEKGKGMAQTEMGRLTSGLGLPPGML
jgi:nucleoid-associated protein EbfC